MQGVLINELERIEEEEEEQKRQKAQLIKECDLFLSFFPSTFHNADFK